MGRIISLITAALALVGCVPPTAPAGASEDAAKAKSALESASKAPTSASKRIALN